MNRDRLFLESICDCLERIAEYTESGEDAFLASRLNQDGVIRNLEVIGEATKNKGGEGRDGVGWVMAQAPASTGSRSAPPLE